MKAKLSLKSAEQTIEFSDIEVNGLSKEEIDKYIYYKYAIPFIQLHSNVNIEIEKDL